MKQHITLKQWDEITKEQKNILWDSGFQREMNIGQMIEFLGDEDFEIEFGIIELPGFRTTYLCDALWKAVKYKLKE